MENAVEKNNTKYKIELMENSSDNIKNLIYSIRGKQVMLDSDVAMLYQYTTKRINETVRRNLAGGSRLSRFVTSGAHFAE